MEETVKPDTEMARATKNFNLRRDGVERHYPTSEYCSVYMKQVRTMVGRGMTHLSHLDRHMVRIFSDDAGVQFIVKLLEDDWTTFDPNESEFVGISTGTLVPSDIARNILDGHTIGIGAYEEFK